MEKKIKGEMGRNRERGRKELIYGKRGGVAREREKNRKETREKCLLWEK